MNRLICRFAMLETKFPKEKLPSRDKAIERKLWHGLPQAAKTRVKAFLDENYPLSKFMDRVEHERQLLLDKHAPRVLRVPEKDRRPAPSSGSATPQTNI